jgi:CheY-like chemotaxis protein
MDWLRLTAGGRLWLTVGAGGAFFQKAMGRDMSRVLLVDDDVASREALAAVLISRGHDVSSAQDGLAALRAAVDSKPELIISDVNMPYLEGPDAVRILKSLPRFRGVPVILMSGADMRAEGLAQVQLRKPVIAERLLEFVEKLVQAGTSSLKPYRNPPATRTTAQDEGWNPALAVASLGPCSDAQCAVRICRGIELMHAQAARISKLRGLGLDIEESNRLYDSLVQSVASLVQCLRA